MRAGEDANRLRGPSRVRRAQVARPQGGYLSGERCLLHEAADFGDGGGIGEEVAMGNYVIAKPSLRASLSSSLPLAGTVAGNETIVGVGGFENSAAIDVSVTKAPPPDRRFARATLPTRAAGRDEKKRASVERGTTPFPASNRTPIPLEAPHARSYL